MIVRPWIAEEVNLLRQMLKEGASTRTISEALPGRTKNAVIGFCDRRGIKLSTRPRGPRKPPKPRIRKKANRCPPRLYVKGIRLEPKMVEQPRETWPAEIIKIDTLKHFHCRYIYGEPRGEYSYCGQPRQEGFSYCPEHVRTTRYGVQRATDNPVPEAIAS